MVAVGSNEASHAICARDLTKHLSGSVVIDHVSFDIPSGSLVGLVGPNGAGKTTLFRLLLGLLHPDSGESSLLGIASPQARSRKNIGFCFDDDGLYSRLGAHENMEFFRRAYADNHPISHYLDRLSLHVDTHQSVSRYSRGMRKRLGLARSLICQPQILLLDEPLLGLDPDGQHELGTLLRELAGEVTILISSHNLESVATLCERVLVINKSLLFDGRIDEFQSRGSTMYEAYRSLIDRENK